MTEPLIKSLREHILDESEPLAGLLRKCLLLGAETGSDSLRQWARFELSGYDETVEVPGYRRLPTPVIKVNSISGNTWVRGQTFNRLQLPPKAQEAISETFTLHQPVEELQRLSASSTLSFTNTALAYAQAVWNAELGPFQQVVDMSYVVPGSMIAGVLGQVRTQLVDLIADLTADAPLTGLPGKAQVDAAVGQHIGTQYNTVIHAANGPTAIGTKAMASTEGLSVVDAIRLLEEVRAVSSDVDDAVRRSELLDAIEGVRSAAERDVPDTGEVMKKIGRLRAVAEGIGVPALTAAVGGAVEAFTSLAMAGAFG